MPHAIIIGAGIIGLSSAFYLQQKGWQVTVFDKNNFDDNCSYGNAGYVCPSHFTPLAAPGIVWQGLKWMLNAKSPFYVKPMLNLSLLDWGWNFLKSANRVNVENAAIPLRDISLLSQHEFEEWAKIPSFEFAYKHQGILDIFQTPAMAGHAQHTLAKATALGLDVSLLNHKELQQMEPHTKINAIGALFFKCDAHLYPNGLMEALKQILRARGVVFRASEEVRSFEKRNSLCTTILTDKNCYKMDAVVIAAGVWSRKIAAMADVNLSLIPGRGYSFTLQDSPYKLNRPAILAEGRVAITPMDGNRMRFGGTMEVVPIGTPPQYSRVEGILKSVRSFFPEFNIPSPPVAKIWYGYRPCSADGLPYIGKTRKFSNVVVATGHSMMGLSLGPGTGKLVAELINNETASINIRPFDVHRFT